MSFYVQVTPSIDKTSENCKQCEKRNFLENDFEKSLERIKLSE